jgi:hypothetical protein
MCNVSQVLPTVVHKTTEFLGGEHCTELENLVCSPQICATIHDELVIPVQSVPEPHVRPNSPAWDLKAIHCRLTSGN